MSYSDDLLEEEHSAELEMEEDRALIGEEERLDASLNAEAPGAFTLDEMLGMVGFGKFQYRVMLVCGLSWMADAIEMTLLSYLMISAQEEFNLSDFWTASLSAVVFVGMWVGSMLFGVLADLRGRRIAFLLSVILTFTASVTSSFAQDFWVLALLRGICGIGIGGVTIPFTLFTEYLPNDKRGSYLIYLNVFWSVGAVFAAGIAWWLIPTAGWRWYVFGCSMPVLIPLLAFPLIPESPRYYVASGQNDLALKAVREAGRVNGTALPDNLSLKGALKAENRGSFLVLLSKELRKTTLLLAGLWFINTMCYYGIVILTPQFFHMEGSEEYLDVFITCLAEFPGIIGAALLINTRGRKQTLAISLGLFALFTILLLTPSPRGVLTLFASISRACMLAAYATLFVYTPEVYPTSMRATGLGACSSFSRIGGFLSAYVAKASLPETSSLPKDLIPLLVFSSLCLIGSMLSISLPIETANRSLDHPELPDSKSRSERSL